MLQGNYPHKLFRQFWGALFFTSNIDESNVLFTTSQDRYKFDKPIYINNDVVIIPKKYVLEITEATTEVEVPSNEMTCAETDLLFLNSDLLISGYERTGNIFTFLFELNAGDVLTFKK